MVNNNNNNNLINNNNNNLVNNNNNNLINNNNNNLVNNNNNNNNMVNNNDNTSYEIDLITGGEITSIGEYYVGRSHDHVMDGITTWDEAKSKKQVGWFTSKNTGTIVYDMKNTHKVTSVKFWNYAEYIFDGVYARGTDNVEILISNDNVNFTQIATDTNKLTSDQWTTVISQENQIPGRYLKINVDKGNYNDMDGIGLLEIEVYGILVK